MSLKDQIKEYSDNAPERQGGSFVQYGKLVCEVNVLTWKGKGNTPLKEPFVEGAEIDAGKQAMEITFNIDVKELNPSLEFDYWTRKILVERSGKTIKTDWSETVLPSLEQVFGDAWADICLGKSNPYVECEQAPSQYVKDGKKDYGVPKFIREFKNKQECINARNEKYGEPESNEEIGIPKEIIKQASGLLKSMKGDKNKVRPILESTEPFNQYDVDAIFAEIEE